jgi:hypothetical protein
MTIDLLLIDDDFTVKNDLYLNLAFAKTKYDLHYAANEQEAFKLLEENTSIRIVCCDTYLYGKFIGPVIAKNIREQYPDMIIIGISHIDCKSLWEGFPFKEKAYLKSEYFEKLLVEFKKE